MLGLAGIPSLVQFVGFLFMPESPRWLVSKGHYDKAEEVLVSIRGTDDVQEEFNAIKVSCQEEMNRQASRSTLCTLICFLSFAVNSNTQAE